MKVMAHYASGMSFTIHASPAKLRFGANIFPNCATVSIGSRESKERATINGSPEELRALAGNLMAAASMAEIAGR